MKEITQLTQEDVNEIIKDFPIEPSFNGVVITLNMPQDEDGIMLSDVGIDEYQFLVAAGPACQIEVGKKVIIDFRKLIMKVPSETDQYKLEEQVNIDTYVVDGIPYGFITDRAIKGTYNR